MTTKFKTFDLRDFIFYYDGFMDDNFCREVVRDLERSQGWQKHTFYDYKTNSSNSNDDDFFVQHFSDVPKIKQISDKLWDLINRYINEDIPQLTNNRTVFNNWAGYTPLRINKYTPETNMKEHVDHIHSMFDGERKGVPILTVLGSLNNDYEGGDLILCGEKVELPAGSVMIFPSNFLYPHKVETITKGTRYSFVTWVW